MNPIEQKAVAHLDCKFAATEVDQDTKTFSGYGAVYGNVDSYGDVIAPGAFAKSLASHKASGTNPLMSTPVGFQASVAE